MCKGNIYNGPLSDNVGSESYFVKLVFGLSENPSVIWYINNKQI